MCASSRMQPASSFVRSRPDNALTHSQSAAARRFCLLIRPALRRIAGTKAFTDVAHRASSLCSSALGRLGCSARCKYTRVSCARQARLTDWLTDVCATKTRRKRVSWLIEQSSSPSSTVLSQDQRRSAATNHLLQIMQMRSYGILCVVGIYYPKMSCWIQKSLTSIFKNAS